jgi:hypothetical protein
MDEHPSHDRLTSANIILFAFAFVPKTTFLRPPCRLLAVTHEAMPTCPRHAPVRMPASISYQPTGTTSVAVHRALLQPTESATCQHATIGEPVGQRPRSSCLVVPVVQVSIGKGARACGQDSTSDVHAVHKISLIVRTGFSSAILLLESPRHIHHMGAAP